MGKLTFEVHDGGIFVKESDVKTFDVEDEVVHTGNAIRKLAEYEDLEEQGKLLKLPCVVGDTVFEIYEGEIIERIVRGILFRGGELLGQDGNGSNFGIFGKTVFLTRQEAEDKLAEMEGKK